MYALISGYLFLHSLHRGLEKDGNVWYLISISESGGRMWDECFLRQFEISEKRRKETVFVKLPLNGS